MTNHTSKSDADLCRRLRQPRIHNNAALADEAAKRIEELSELLGTASRLARANTDAAGGGNQ